MTGTTDVIFDVSADQVQSVTLKIWSKTGGIFQEIFPIDRTTFAHVKYLAVQYFLRNSSNKLVRFYRSMISISLDEVENYKLISIESKKSIDEQKTLGQEKVQNGG